MNRRSAIAATVADRNSELLANCHKLLSTLESVMQRIEVKDQDLLNITRVALLMRIATAFESVVLLATHGLVTEAHAQFRSQIEALFRFSAICRQPEMLIQYVGQDFFHKEGLLRAIKNLHRETGGPPAGAPSDEQIDKLQLDLDQRRQEVEVRYAQKLKYVSAEKWAMSGGELGLFFGRYAVASGHGHHAPTSLRHQLHRREDGRVSEFHLAAKESDVVELIVDSAYATRRAIERFSETFNIDAADELRAAAGWIDEAYSRQTAPSRTRTD